VNETCYNGTRVLFEWVVLDCCAEEELVEIDADDKMNDDAADHDDKKEENQESFLVLIAQATFFYLRSVGWL